MLKLLQWWQGCNYDCKKFYSGALAGITSVKGFTVVARLELRVQKADSDDKDGIGCVKSFTVVARLKLRV